jgi:hypothetical protein
MLRGRLLPIPMVRLLWPQQRWPPALRTPRFSSARLLWQSQVLHPSGNTPVQKRSGTLATSRKSNRMKFIRLVAVTTALLISAHRLPAPIQEVPESPTPAPSTATPKSSPNARPSASVKARVKPQSTVVAPASARHAGPYAGIWRGVITCSFWGNIEHRIVVDDTQKTMTVSRIGSGAGGANGTAPASIGADGLTAQLPGLNGTWSLRPNPDGKTAQVKLTGFMLGSSAVFSREQ